MVLAPALIVALLSQGCTPRRPEPEPLPPEETAWLAAGVREWRELRLAWRPVCAEHLARLQVDPYIERCPIPAWECLDRPWPTLHIHPQIETLRGPGAYRNTFLHGVVHVLVVCSGLDRRGDPGHSLEVWESAGPDGALRRMQARAREAS